MNALDSAQVLGPSIHTYRLEGGGGVRLVVEAAFDASRYGGADRRDVTNSDIAEFDAAHARLAGGAPLVTSCSLDGDVEVTPEQRAAVVAYLADASRYLGWVLGKGTGPGPAPTGVTLARDVTVPPAPFARAVSVAIRAGDATTNLPPPDVAALAAALGDTVLLATERPRTGPSLATVWAVRAGAPFGLSAARVYALAPLSAVRVDVTDAAVPAFDPARGLTDGPARTMSFHGFDLDEWAAAVLDALETVDTPGLARTRTGLATAIASGLRLVHGDEPDAAAYDAARALVAERLLHRVNDRPQAVTQHDLAAPADFDLVVEGPRTHRLARGETRLTYAGDLRSPLASRLAYVEHPDAGPLAVAAPPAVTADVPGPLPLRAHPESPSILGAECVPREIAGDAAAALRKATQWTYRLAYATTLAEQDTVEVVVATAPPAAAFAPLAVAHGDLPDRVARLHHLLPDLLPGGRPGPHTAAALTTLADGLDTAWAAWAATSPPAPGDDASLTVREDAVDGALRVTVAYSLPGGLVPAVLVDGCEAVAADPAPAAGNRAMRAWTYRGADGQPLPRAAAPAGRTVELAWLDALRDPVVTAEARVVRNAGGAPAFVYSTPATAYRPVVPELGSDLDVDVSLLSGEGPRPLTAHLAAVAAALARDGVAVSAEVAVAYATSVGPGLPVTTPVTLVTRAPLADAFGDTVGSAVTAWLASAEPDPAGALTFDVTLYGAEPAAPVRLRGLSLPLVAVSR